MERKIIHVQLTKPAHDCSRTMTLLDQLRQSTQVTVYQDFIKHKIMPYIAMVEIIAPAEMVEEITAKLKETGEIREISVSDPPQPLYLPNDPQALDIALTQQTITASEGPSALDIATGENIIIGIIETPGNGADYSDPELGGSGDRDADWQRILNGTHPKFTLYTDPEGNPVDPYGTGHGNTTARCAAAVMDNNTAYLGSAPNAMIMMALADSFPTAIIRMTDLGVHFISISYVPSPLYRSAIQYATQNNVQVVYAHGSNDHVELTSPPPWEAIMVGGFNTSLQSDRSYGVSLTCISRGVPGSQESWSTPTTAGILALLREHNPSWNIHDIHSALITSAYKPAGMGGAEWTKEYGWGIPDAYAALQLSLDQLKPLPPLDFTVSVDGDQITASWTPRRISNYHHTTIIAKEGSPPTSHSDGITAWQGTDTTATFQLPYAGDWYLAIFDTSESGIHSTITDYCRFALLNYPGHPLLQIYPLRSYSFAPNSIGTFDVGPAKINTHKTVILQLRNGGTDPLIISSISISPGEPVYSISLDPPVTLDPNEVYYLPVAFTPRERRWYNGTITINWNSPTGDPTIIDIQGRGTISMANYPISYDTFVDKKAFIDIIQASDINTIQDCIAAIEQAIGLNPQGSKTTLVERLAESLLTDGKLDFDNIILYHMLTSDGHATILDKFYPWEAQHWDQLTYGSATITYSTSPRPHLELETGTTASSGAKTNWLPMWGFNRGDIEATMVYLRAGGYSASDDYAYFCIGAPWEMDQYSAYGILFRDGHAYLFAGYPLDPAYTDTVQIDGFLNAGMFTCFRLKLTQSPKRLTLYNHDGTEYTYLESDRLPDQNYCLEGIEAAARNATTTNVWLYVGPIFLYRRAMTMSVT